MQSFDEALDRAREGDAAAFAELYDGFHVPVFRYLAARLDDRMEAEDMTSEVFVDAARRIRGFEGSADAFAGWLFTIARHDLTDRRRAERRRRVDPVAEVPIEAQEPDPADQVASRLDAARVREALARLTPDQREVILLKFAAGRSNDEVAHLLDKPVGAVKALQHRAVASLRRLLEEGT